mmetsp:Transcript_20802/g.58529  ORF Transcript_20802/g.58529 Transcript_20802/m.58529 type:complete len:149 (+) Transcript_20802:76-522(+)
MGHSVSTRRGPDGEEAEHISPEPLHGEEAGRCPVQDHFRALNQELDAALYSGNRGLFVQDPGLFSNGDLFAHPLDVQRRHRIAQLRAKAGPCPKLPSCECLICLSQLSEGDVVVQTLCEHTFHLNCLEPVVCETDACPTCRGRITGIG